MVDALDRAGSTTTTDPRTDASVIFTQYPDLTHDSWTAAYGNPEVYKWMLRNRRHVKGDEHVVPEENKVIVS
jgi:hypothetical protein